VSGGDVAFAYMLEHYAGVLKDGSKSDIWRRDTSCFRKIGSRWYDVHDHVSVPADFATGKAMLALKP
jgi:ketosteroid isomerase-like protein